MRPPPDYGRTSSLSRPDAPTLACSMCRREVVECDHLGPCAESAASGSYRGPHGILCPMPMPYSFTRRLAQARPSGRVGRLPLILTLVFGLLASAGLRALGGSGSAQTVVALAVGLLVLFVDAMQSTLTSRRRVARLVFGVVVLLIAYLLAPIVFFLGPALVAALVAFVVFLRRKDPWGVGAAVLAAAGGVLIRIVLSSGSLHPWVFTVGVLALAATCLGAVAWFGAKFDDRADRRPTA